MVCVNMSLKRKYACYYDKGNQTKQPWSPLFSKQSHWLDSFPRNRAMESSSVLQSINGPKEGHKKGSSPATMVFMFSSAMSIAEDFRQKLLMSQTGFEIKI